MKLLNNLYTISLPPSEMVEAGSFISTIHLIADSMIYKAHFPNDPITPGACIIQIAQELYEQFCGHAVEITGVENAKFIKTVVPVPDNHYNYCFKKESVASDTEKLQVIVSCDDSIYAKFSIICKTI